MSFQLPDPASTKGAQIARRLQDDPLIWLTTVDATGAPHPVTVWFLWDETTSTLLIYNRANAQRLVHLQNNPKVALNLEAGGGREVIVLTGIASVRTDDPPVDQVPAYIEKYREWFSRFQFTPQQLAGDLTVPVRVHPSRLRYAANGT